MLREQWLGEAGVLGAAKWAALWLCGPCISEKARLLLGKLIGVCLEELVEVKGGRRLRFARRRRSSGRLVGQLRILVPRLFFLLLQRLFILALPD